MPDLRRLIGSLAKKVGALGATTPWWKLPPEEMSLDQLKRMMLGSPKIGAAAIEKQTGAAELLQQVNAVSPLADGTLAVRVVDFGSSDWLRTRWPIECFADKPSVSAAELESVKIPPLAPNMDEK
jgi:hypothetical protein